jgi:hypothetical protein
MKGAHLVQSDSVSTSNLLIFQLFTHCANRNRWKDVIQWCGSGLSTWCHCQARTGSSACIANDVMVRTPPLVLNLEPRRRPLRNRPHSVSPSITHSTGGLELFYCVQPQFPICPLVLQDCCPPHHTTPPDNERHLCFWPNSPIGRSGSKFWLPVVPADPVKSWRHHPSYGSVRHRLCSFARSSQRAPEAAKLSHVTPLTTFVYTRSSDEGRMYLEPRVSSAFAIK